MSLRRDHSEVVLDFDGKPIPNNIGTEEAPEIVDLTFKHLANICLYGLDRDERLGPEKKSKLFRLALKFHRGKVARITEVERDLLKERAGVLLGQMTYGRFCDWIEGKPQVVGDDGGSGDDDEDDDGSD